MDLYGTENVHHTLVITINIIFIIRHHHYRRRHRHRRYHQRRRIVIIITSFTILTLIVVINLMFIGFVPGILQGRGDHYEYDKYLMPKNNATIN